MTNAPEPNDSGELVNRLRLLVADHSRQLKEHAGIIEALQAAVAQPHERLAALETRMQGWENRALYMEHALDKKIGKLCERLAALEAEMQHQFRVHCEALKRIEKLEAAALYTEAAIKHFREFARTG